MNNTVAFQNERPKKKRPAPTPAEVAAAKRVLSGEVTKETRQLGENGPIAISEILEVDKGMLPERGMKMRELVRENHQRYLDYQEKCGSIRKVSKKI